MKARVKPGTLIKLTTRGTYYPVVWRVDDGWDDGFPELTKDQLVVSGTVGLVIDSYKYVRPDKLEHIALFGNVFVVVWRADFKIIGKV